MCDFTNSFQLIVCEIEHMLYLNMKYSIFKSSSLFCQLSL